MSEYTIRTVITARKSRRAAERTLQRCEIANEEGFNQYPTAYSMERLETGVYLVIATETRSWPE